MLSFAHDFEVDGIYYNITSSSEPYTVAVTYRGDDFFNSADYTNAVTIPESVTYDGKTYSVTSIGTSAFQECSSLTSITIPRGVTNIGNMAFCDCNSISSITVNTDNPLSISSNIFNNRGNVTLYVPVGCIEAYKAADVWKEFKEIKEIGSISPSYGIGDVFTAKTVEGVEMKFKVISETEVEVYGETSSPSIDQSYSGSVTIPESVDGYIVSKIGYHAFYNCGLTGVIIPTSVAVIDHYAFRGNVFTTIVIPKGVKTIGEGVFTGCGNLSQISVDSENRVYDSRDNCNAIIETASNTLIVGCKGTIIPHTVSSIGNEAFESHYNMTSIFIPGNVINIGRNAFANCNRVTQLEISDGVKTIGDGAFFGLMSCDGGLESIYIPSSVTSIGNQVFGCNLLSSIIVDEKNQYYDSRYNCNAIIEKSSNKLIAGCKNTIIPNDVSSIAFAAFQGCYHLSSLSIPNSVTEIGEMAFYYCNSLKKITIPRSITSIGDSAFGECGDLVSITINREMPLYISQSVFSSCAAATLYVPTGSVEAYESADVWNEFKEIKEIKSTLPLYEVGDIFTAPTEEGVDMKFRVISDTEVEVYGENWEISSIDKNYEGGITIPKMIKGFDVTGIGDFAFYFCNITSVNIPSQITKVGICAFEYCYKLTSISLPENVESIGDNAFMRCDGLVKVIIPRSVVSIGNSAFYNCNALANVEIGDGVKTIGNAAFYGCGILHSIHIPKSVESIGKQAFACNYFLSITVDSENPYFDSRDNCNAIIETATNTIIAGCQNTIIPNGIITIGKYAFYACRNLKDISIPSSVTSIGEYAFYYCENLKSIRIPSTVTDIKEGAFNKCYYLISVIIESEKPLVITENDFTNRSNLTLYVPIGCKAAYEAADVWKEFGSIVEMESPVAEDGNVIPIDAEKLGLTSEFAAFDESRISYENKNPWGVQGLVEVGSNDKMTVNVTNVQYRAKDLAFDDYDRIVINGDTLFASRGIEGDTSPRTFSSHNPATAMEVPVTGDYLHIVAKESGWAYVALKASMNKSYAVFEDGQAIGYKVALGNNYFPVFNLEIKGDGKTNYRTEQINPLLNEYTTNADTLKAMERGSGVGVLYFPVSQGKEYVVCAGGAKMRAFGVYYTEQEGVKIKLLSELKDPLVLMEQKETPAPHAIGDIFTATTVEGVDMKFRVISETEVEVYGETSSPSIDQTYAGSITIPETVEGYSVTSLGYESFYSCPALTSVAIPNGVTSITRRAFCDCSSLSAITIPQSVTKIFTNAFYHCSGLNSIVVESGNTVFDSRDNCNAIIETASNRLVQGCSATVIPNSVTSIGSYAFRGRSNLVSIAIPNSVTSIGDGAFAGCSGMKEIVSYIEEPFATNSYCWFNVPKDIPLYVPVGTKEKYQSADGWKDFTNIIEFGGDVIEPTEEAKEVDMTAVPDQMDLNGMVVGDTYYALNKDNGDGADSENGCVVINSITTDEAVSSIVGKDISDESVKDAFKGIIFMVPAGTGKVSVTGQTVGSSSLMVKVGSLPAQAFQLAERETVQIPYTVTEPTYVYIYAGTSAQGARAQGATTAAAAENSVKVYSYKWEPAQPTGIVAIDNGQWTIDNEAGAWYTLDGRKLAGKPAKKGVYIHNGRKVAVK